MYERIQAAYANMRQAIIEFNERWPSMVISGAVWRLPLLREQKTPDLIPVTRLEGESAVRDAVDALQAFELDLGQAPGTVFRLPGYFVLEETVLEQVRMINALKDALDEAIELTRVELNMIKDARPRIMRRALGANFNTKQLLRKIHSFEMPPRKLTFTWAGHTPGTTRIAVGQLREKLRDEAQHRADREQIALETTPEWQELRSLVNMDAGEHLVQYKNVAPHPRAMLWFSGSSRYDAMIHANLPVFVVAGPSDLEVVELQTFSKADRISPRADKKTREEAVSRLDIFLPPKKRRKQTPAPTGSEVNAEALERSTYSPAKDG